MFRYLLCVGVFITWTAFSGRAQATVALTEAFTGQLLSAEVGVLADMAPPHDTSTLTDLTAALAWSDSSATFLFGLSRHTRWLRMALRNDADHPLSLMLELANPHLNELTLYQLHGAQLVRADTVGVNFPFGRRPVLHQNFIFPILLPARQEFTLLLRLAPADLPQNFNLYLWNENHRVTQQAEAEGFLLLGFFLISLFFLLLVVFTNVAFRQTSLWFYAGYVGLGTLMVFTDSGLGYRYLWPNWIYWQKIAVLLLANAYLIAGVQFIRSYFLTWRRFPRFDRIFRYTMAAALVLVLCSVCIPWLPLPLVHILAALHYLLFLLSSATFVVLFVRIWYGKSRLQSGWFLLAFSLHGAGIVITLLQYFRLLPHASWAAVSFANGLPLTFYPQPMLMLGMLLEIPIVLYVVSRRFKQLMDSHSRQSARLAALRTEQMNTLVLGAETERRRIAQDLHDGLSVLLAAIKMKANLLETQTPEPLRAPWQEIMHDLEYAYQELRRITHNLSPQALFRLGLNGALRDIIDRSQALRPEMTFHYYYNLPEAELSKQAQIHLYRIVLELLNNILKHAEADEVTIQLTRYNGHVLLMVEDNGRGFVVGANQERGIGLRNMQHRVELLEGKLSVDSTPGRGATITGEFPLEALR